MKSSNFFSGFGFLPVAALFLSVCWFSGCSSHHAKNTAELNEALRSLDEVIKKLPELNAIKQRELDSCAQLYRGATGLDKVHEAMLLARRYRLFNADSSLHYATLACQLAETEGNKTQIYMATLERITTLATLGFFSNAQNDFDALEVDTASLETRRGYYYTGRTLYGYKLGYMNSQNEFYNQNRQMYRQFDDSLIACLPADSDLRHFLRGERMAWEGRNAEAEKTNLRLLAKLEPDTRLYAMVSYQLAMCFRTQGDMQSMACYLAKGAEGDLRAGIRDGMALPMLASYLYGNGQIDKAYKYINLSLSDAAEGGLRWRAYGIALLLPGIDEAYNSTMAMSQRRLILYAVITSIMLLAVLGLLYQVHRQRHKLHRQAKQLEEKSKIQTNYIGNFVAMCASYAERLGRLNATVDRKLSAGDIEGLRKMLKSGKFMEAEDEDFSRIFDTAFLDIYPDFVSEVNKLLKPEERVEWKKKESLTPELRIYALVKLGVNESTRIAQILQYSVSTVYAYRNRMRNKALDRENFDMAVAKIGVEDIPNM